MKKFMLAIFILTLLAPIVTHASTITFTDKKDVAGVVHYWEGFNNPNLFVNSIGYADNNDVWGTPDLLGGELEFKNDIFLNKISLDYVFPTLSGATTFTLGDWFFDVDGDNNWDYVMVSPVSDSTWTSLKNDPWNIYKVPDTVDFEKAYTTSNPDYYYAKATSGIPRSEHPVKAIITAAYGNSIGTANLDGWINNQLDKELTATWNFNYLIPFEFGKNFNIGFAVTCANDVIMIKGKMPDSSPNPPVPEPGTALLLGIGMLGLAAVTRRRKA